jgi:hypothetical protein
VSTPVRARVQTLHEFAQLNRSNINRTCVQHLQRFRTHHDALSWENTAACVQISPSAAEPGVESRADRLVGLAERAVDAGGSTADLDGGAVKAAVISEPGLFDR